MKVLIPESLKCKNTCAAIEKASFTSPLLVLFSLILNHDLSQLLAILDNLVEVSDLTDEERLWVYDKFASKTGKGATRKEADAPFIHFVSVCLATKGSCSGENQNALDAAFASWVDEAIFDQRLGREVRFDCFLGPELEGTATRCPCARAVGEQQILGSRVQGRIPIDPNLVPLPKCISSTSFTPQKLAHLIMETKEKFPFLSLLTKMTTSCT